MHRLILILLFCSVWAHAQNNPLLERDADWKEGTVMLNDGKELTGLIKYDDKAGNVSFSSGTVSKIMTARNLMGFEYFDPNANKQRIFYSLEIFSDTGVKVATIFEVIRLFESFAVLSRIEPVDFKKVNNNYNPNNSTMPGVSINTRDKIKISQRETIWFLPNDGEPTLYLEVVARENQGQVIDLSHDKRKIQDKDIFEKCTGSYYTAIETFAKENYLSFKSKEDLMKMLDLYEKLSAKK